MFARRSEIHLSVNAEDLSLFNFTSISITGKYNIIMTMRSNGWNFPR